MMGFQTAWATLNLGDVVQVSGGGTEPPTGPETVEHRVWRSHNFTGTLTEKVDGMVRWLRFDLPADSDGNLIGYAVGEDSGLSFELQP